MNKNHLLMAAAVLVITAVAGYAVWDRHQTKTLQDATLTRIDNATQALRTALAPAQDPIAQSQVVAAAVERVEQDLSALRATATSRILLLGAGADTYLHTTRELLKRQAAVLVLDTSVRNGIAAFRDHLAGSRAASNWAGDAVRLKNRLEQDFREYQRAVDAHTGIADGYADAHKALAGLVAEGRVPAAAEITAARDRTIAAAKVLTAEMEAARRMAAPR